MVADAIDKREALRADIQQGINSGPGRPVQQVTADLQARYQQWAEQGALFGEAEAIHVVRDRLV